MDDKQFQQLMHRLERISGYLAREVPSGAETSMILLSKSSKRSRF